MRQVKFIQIRNPLVLLLFVPFLLALMALGSLFFMGAGLLGRRRRPLRKAGDGGARIPRPNAEGVIEAEYKVISEPGLRDDQPK